MCEKCFELEYLQKYQNNSFIYERKSINEENIFSYKSIIQETEKLIKSFRAYKIENNVGLAIDVKEHSPAICVLLLGILNHNCYFFSLDLGDIKNAENYLKSSGVKYVVSSSKRQNSELFEKEAEQIIIFNHIFYIKTLKPTIKYLRNGNLCYTIATSGSTGQPKMVHVPYDCLKPNIVSLSSMLNVHSEDIIFLSSPLTFDPFVVEFFMALMNGTGLLITSNEIRLQPPTLIEILFPRKSSSMKGITIYQTTPSLFRRFGTNNIKNILSENTSLKCLILGGEEFPTFFEICKWIPLGFKTCGKHIFNIYGITEVSCWASIYEFTAGDCLNQIEHVPIGKPLDDFTYFRICDDTGHVLPFKACTGELEMGSGVRHCFIPEYDENIKILESQEIIYRKTGDFVERDELGNISYLGRTNSTIKRMGKRICLDSLSKKIENLLNTTSSSFNIVILCPKETMKLTFYITNTHDITEEHKRSVQYVVKHNLENYERPDEIIYSIEPLPLTEHGKIDRIRISEEITKNKQFMTPILIFKNFIINLLGLNIEITSGAFSHNRKRLKIISDMSFIEAGGTSFQALSLASEMTEHMENPSDQRTILEMLLDNKVGLNKILEYLETCAHKTPEITKLNLPTKNLKKNLKLTFKLMWCRDLKKCIDASPTIYEDSFIAVGSHSHLLLIADVRTGRQISMLELPDRIECPVVFVSFELAVVGCYDGFLYGFDFNKGSISWKINVEGMIKAKPLVVKDCIIVASYAEKYNVVACDLKTLALKWHVKFGTKGIFSSPVYISEEFVLLCSLDGSYGLIEIENGSLKWQKKLDSPIFATAGTIKTPTEELFIVLAEVKGQITICKAENGEKVTSFQTEGNIFSGFQLYKQDLENILIIFGCHDKNVYCLNFEIATKKLNLIWKYFMHAPVFSTPIQIDNGYIFCCSNQGMMALLGVTNAELMATHNLNAEVFSTPICLNDKYVYLGARDNNLYAFELV